MCALVLNWDKWEEEKPKLEEERKLSKKEKKALKKKRKAEEDAEPQDPEFDVSQINKCINLSYNPCFIIFFLWFYFFLLSIGFRFMTHNKVQFHTKI